MSSVMYCAVTLTVVCSCQNVFLTLGFNLVGFMISWFWEAQNVQVLHPNGTLCWPFSVLTIALKTATCRQGH